MTWSCRRRVPRCTGRWCGATVDRAPGATGPARLRFSALTDADARAAAVAVGEAAIASDVDPRVTGIATHFQPGSVATAFMFALDRGARPAHPRRRGTTRRGSTSTARSSGGGSALSTLHGAPPPTA